MLHCSFRHDQIDDVRSYAFGHTLLCYLSLASTNWPQNFRDLMNKLGIFIIKPTDLEVRLLIKSACFAPALSVTKLANVRDMILVTLCCAT
jgi:hypothetical protein